MPGSWFEVNDKTPTTLLIRRWKTLEDEINGPRPMRGTYDYNEWRNARNRARIEMVPVLQEMKRRGFPVVEETPNDDAPT